MKRTAFIFIALTFFAMPEFYAQVKTPAASPQCTINQRIGLIEASLEYSRPSMKGRKIFGELVPFGELWRTGANASTKITFSDSVRLEGHDIAPGTYAIYTIPGKDKWMIIIHKNTKLWGAANYNSSEDVVRFEVKPTKNATVETFTVNFTEITNNSANIRMEWENTAVKFRMETDTDAKVMSSIASTLNAGNAAPNDYNAAASYLFETKRDLNKALEYVNKALEKFEEQQRNVYWVYHLKAKILAGLSQFRQAVETAEKSKDLARQADNADYVRLNEKLIKEWQSKI